MREIPKNADGTLKTPPIVEPDLSKKGNVTMVRQERKYELITPLFGGGVTPAQADELTPIRGTEVRGHLRFWWRAVRGGQFGGNLTTMKTKETELWGAASTPDKPHPSQVHIAVTMTSRGSEVNPYRNGRPTAGWDELAYAAFPLQESEAAVVSGVRFNLSIVYPADERKEVEAALWAWETFGGVGARTRRGFGALKSGSWPAKPNRIETRLAEELAKHIEAEEWPDHVPHLAKDLSFVVVTRKESKNRLAFQTAWDAWEEIIGYLKGFRQSRTGKFGRSNWPEPEQVRRITGQRKASEDTALLAIERFPRAAFGLPIIFHFKGGNTEAPYDNGLDPMDTTLKGGQYAEGKHRERLASPLILRPLACGNNEAVGLAVLLQSPRTPPEGLSLTGDGIVEIVRSDLPKADALKIKPLKPAAAKLLTDDAQIDVLQAFIDMLREREKV